MSDTSDQNTNDPAGPTDPPAAPSGSRASGGSTAGALTTVNPQILDAVKQTTSFVTSAAGNTGTGIAYQKVSQAGALAIQDAADFMRNLMTISATATGVAVTKMVEDPAINIPLFTPVIAQAEAIATFATTQFTAVGEAATKVVTGFPSKGS
jgi:hypothetical protein